MTKADIAQKIQFKTGLTKKESADIIESVFLIMKESLISGEDLKISGFGKFFVKQTSPRIGRNPVTGESMTIVARRILKFKFSPLLKKSVISVKEK